MGSRRKRDMPCHAPYNSTRLSIDLLYLDAGNYTMVVEMYVDDGITIDEIEGASGTLSGVTTKSNIDGTKTRSIIHFSYNGLASGFNDLDIDIKLKSKTDPQTTIYVVVYGVKGNVNNVSVGLWDRLYYYDNDSIEYEVPIDMKGKKIKGVGDGTSNSDAVNYQQLNEFESNLVKLFRNEIAAAVRGVYFHTRNPAYNTYSTKAITKTLKWSSITNYQWSDSNDLILNSDSITIRHTGVYIFYYQEKIKGSGNGSQKGFIGFDVENSINNEARYTEKVDSSSSSPVFLNFMPISMVDIN